MLTKKKTLIIDYYGMNVGGIEGYFANLISYALDAGYRVVWITTERDEERSSYPVVLKDGVEKMHVMKTPFGPIYPRIHFKAEEDVIVLTCEPLQFILSDILRAFEGGARFNHFLLLPHDRGGMYYPETFASWGPVRALLKRVCNKWAIVFSCHDCIFGFEKKHLEAFRENYGVGLSCSRILPSIVQIPEVDALSVSQRSKSRNKNFIITSCARFDFPHKGYLVGLIKVFAKLKREFPNIQLRIIGYGDGLGVLNKEIDKLREEVRDSISLLGKLSQKELTEEFERSHLNIGVAGALLQGARRGVPSLIARQYCYECETYGLYSRNNRNTLRDTPGDSPEQTIKAVMHLSDTDYIKLCMETAECARENVTVDPGFLFDQSENIHLGCISKKDRVISRLIYVYSYIKRRIFGVSGY